MPAISPPSSRRGALPNGVSATSVCLTEVMPRRRPSPASPVRCCGSSTICSARVRPTIRRYSSSRRRRRLLDTQYELFFGRLPGDINIQRGNTTIYHSGARGPLPSGRGVNGPLLLLCSNTRALLPVGARALTPCGVACGPAPSDPDASSFRRTPGKSLGILSFSREAPGFRHGECHFPIATCLVLSMVLTVVVNLLLLLLRRR